MVLNLTENFPPITAIRWFNLSVLVITPALACYGVMHVDRQIKTLLFAAAYYVFTMLGKRRIS
jgi:stearoyl-CoA desaturase (Delta-9 desaturase)